MDCMLVFVWKAHALVGVDGVVYFITIAKKLKKTETAISSMQTMFPKDLYFS